MDLQEEKGLTYMFITHDLSVVKHISNNIAVMYLGQIVEKCETKRLFNHTLHPYTKALLSAIPVPSLKKKRERILPLLLPGKSHGQRSLAGYSPRGHRGSDTT